jgi:choline dehydrogenase-like flavoprotein
VRLEWDPGQRTVARIAACEEGTGREHIFSCDAVVLAAGPLASPKILLQSVSPSFPEGLGDTDGILGRFLHDHTLDLYRIELGRGIARLDRTACFPRGSYDRIGPLSAAQTQIDTRISTAENVLALTPLKTRRISALGFGSAPPEPHNRVSLDPDQLGPDGLPLLDVHYRFDPDAEARAAAERERLLSVLDAAGHQPRLLGEMGEFVPGESFHFSGAVRMHVSPRHGMLDRWNRLHAAQNVAVVDASSFTTGVEKNPTLTVMALSARAAQRLAFDLKRG